ncbi:MAG: hypothetical protein KTR26_06165 [Flammeovirgaceae bacterium]|nr:hypothetical protein [Flammeovirgaceae bacterium]
MEDKDYSFLKVFMEEPIFIVEKEGQNHIIAEEPTSGYEANTNQQSIRFYGEKDKNVLVLVDLQNTDLLKTPEYDLLLKIMGAINLTLNQFTLVNVADNATIDFPILTDEFNFQQLIVFGITPSSLSLGDSAVNYFPVKNEAHTFIFSDSLSELIKDIGKKKLLWASLKNLF